jgi:hypothetical protein
VAAETRAGERYASQVGQLWGGIARTLARIEALASDPERLAEDEEAHELRRLQYRLHTAAEDAVGLSPPPGTEPLHQELAEALADARDLTGELVEAIEQDGPGVLYARIYEWRGALFRVRLARRRLAAVPPVEPSAEELPGLVAPLSALGLSLGGTAAFLVGATAGPWSLWICGAIALCLSVVVYRP